MVFAQINTRSHKTHVLPSLHRLTVASTSVLSTRESGDDGQSSSDETKMERLHSELEELPVDIPMDSVVDVQRNGHRTGRRWSGDDRSLLEEVAVVTVTTHGAPTRRYAARVLDKLVRFDEIEATIAMRKHVEKMVHDNVVSRDAYKHFTLPLLRKKDRDLLAGNALYRQLLVYFVGWDKSLTEEDIETAQMHVLQSYAGGQLRQKLRDAPADKETFAKEIEVHVQKLDQVAISLQQLLPTPKRRRGDDEDEVAWNDELRELLSNLDEGWATFRKAFKLLSSKFSEWIDSRHTFVFTSLLPPGWTNYTSPSVFSSSWSRDLRESDAQAVRAVIERSRKPFIEQMVVSVWLMMSLGSHADWEMRNVIIGVAPDGTPEKPASFCVAIVDFARFYAHTPREHQRMRLDNAGAYYNAARGCALQMLSYLDKHFRLEMTLDPGGEDLNNMQMFLEGISQAYMAAYPERTQ